MNENNANINEASRAINVLVTLNEGYIHQLCVMLTSMRISNPNLTFCLYVLHSSLREKHFKQIQSALGAKNALFPIKADGNDFAKAPTTGRYPVEMYFRIFAARYLPENLDRILYLDPDIIVRKSLSDLYDMPLGDKFIAAASHVGKVMTRINSKRLNAKDMTDPYINSGVMLMNLDKLRRDQNEKEVFSYIEKYKNRLILPDQDVISGLYGSKITLLDPYIYNMTERLFALHIESESWMNIDWVKENSVIIHYCGRNKPWKPGYIGTFDTFYREAEEKYLAGAVGK